MSELNKKSPYMDYRDSVPFINLSGFVVKQPQIIEEIPVKSLQEHLFRKKVSNMINFRRLQYCKLCEDYRNGRR